MTQSNFGNRSTWVPYTQPILRVPSPSIETIRAGRVREQSIKSPKVSKPVKSEYDKFIETLVNELKTRKGIK